MFYESKEDIEKKDEIFALLRRYDGNNVCYSESA